MSTDNHRFTSLIESILGLETFAVVGASRDRQKPGFQVYTSLKRAGYRVYPINPNADEIDGDEVYPSLDALPDRPDCVVCIVPPAQTVEVMHKAGMLKIPNAWLQPGAESLAAINMAQAHGVNVVHGGPCIMVSLATRVTK